MVPHRGFHMVPLPIGGFSWFNSPSGESFPTGGDRSTPHRGSLSPPGEVIALPTWGVLAWGVLAPPTWGANNHLVRGKTTSCSTAQ